MKEREKMTKKFLSSMLAVAMLSTVGSICAISASAEDYDITGGEITFRINNGWKYEDAKYYIHIWDGREGGLGLYEWQSEKERMTISEDGKTATYNVPEGNWNLLILSDAKGTQTYDTVFNQKCIGDTFTTVVDETLAPVDNPKGSIIVWDNNPDCGRHRQIVGLNVEGDAYIPGETDKTIFDDFCEYYGPQEDGKFVWDEICKEDFDMTWEDAKAYVASQLDLTEIPTEESTEEATEASTEKVTEKATQAPTEKPTQTTTTATIQSTTNNSNGTVATADNNVLKVLSSVLLLSVAVTALSQRRKLYK